VSLLKKIKLSDDWRAHALILGTASQNSFLRAASCNRTAADVIHSLLLLASVIPPQFLRIRVDSMRGKIFRTDPDTHVLSE
jgi:hypothetical protein